MAATAALPPALPTPSQVLSLAAQVPSRPTPIPSETSLLAPFISLLHTSWIRDFLLSPEPLHLPYLSAPSLASSSFTCALSATRVEKPSPVPTLEHPETHHLRNRYLFAPAFTAANVTAGFGVMDCAMHLEQHSSPAQWILSCERVLMFRFVRDSESHTACEVYDAPEYDVILLFHTHFISSTRSRSVTALFTRSVLHAALKEGEEVPEPNAFLPALQFVQHDEQTHACKVCAQPATAYCGCKLPTMKPRHPFDNDHFRKSMTLHQGVYESIANKQMYAFGKRSRQILLGARVQISSTVDCGFVQDAAAWALTQGLGSVPPSDPRTGVVAIEWQETATDKEQGEDLISEFLRDDGAGDALLAEMGSGSADGSAEGASEPSSSALAARLNGNQDSGVSVYLGSSTDANDIAERIESPMYGCQAEEEWWHNQSVSWAPESIREPLATPTDKANVAGSDEVRAGSISKGDMSNNTCRNIEQGSSERGDVASGSGVSGNNETQCEQGASGNGAMPAVEASGRKEGEEEKKARLLAERRLRLIARRERNRIAARRSNLKRKQTRDGLVAELEGAKGRVEELRGMEMHLRRENLRLRGLAGGLSR